MAGWKILLVEGTDDEHVLKHICGNRGVAHLDEVKPHGSVDTLLESIPVRLKASEDGDIVGVVIDADTNVDGAGTRCEIDLSTWDTKMFRQTPAPDGTILDPPAGTLLPRVGIWIMPDNRTSGILEDFLRFLVPQEGHLFKHVQSSVATIPEGERRFSAVTEPKAIIHTWLAWQKEPGKPLGTAITARFLDPNVAQVDVLVSWLNRLFFP